MSQTINIEEQKSNFERFLIKFNKVLNFKIEF
jgi:hypothetical protein